MRGASKRRRHGLAALATAVAALALAACSPGSPAASTTTTSAAGGGTTTSTTVAGSTTTTAPPATSVPPTSVPPPAGVVVSPADVGPIVAADTAVNNRANATLSLSLQDSHETCLQDTMDDLFYRAQDAAGETTSSPAFEQLPKTAYVPRQSGYPAVFSVLASDVEAKEPTTTVLLDYVRTAAGSPWKLASSSGIIGPTDAGVAVPAVATDAGGYATALDPSAGDGLAVAPDQVAARVAAALTTQAASGTMPAGVTADFGKPGEGDYDPVDPRSVDEFFTSSESKVSVSYTTTAPTVAAEALAGPGCAFPSYRLADGGGLVVFAVYQHITLSVSGSGWAQPADPAESPFSLLAAGTYRSVNSLQADVCVAVVPKAGSTAPIELIGEGVEALSQTGVGGGEITT